MLNGKIHYFDWVMFNSYVTNYQRVIFKKIGWLNLPYSIIYIHDYIKYDFSLNQYIYPISVNLYWHMKIQQIQQS